MARAPLPPGTLDPRARPSDQAEAVDSGGALRPAVAGRASSGGVWLIGGGAVLLGLIAFLWLSSHRPGPPKEVRAIAALDASGTALPLAAQAPPEIAAMEAARRGAVAPVAEPPPPPPPAPAIAVVTPTPIAAPVAPAPLVDTGVQRRKAPTLVVDFGSADVVTTGNTIGAGAARAPALSADEQFASRLQSASEPDRSRAVMLRNKSGTVPQGAMIPAVLETALNSDLPGFTRAVVSRDVRSFDGSVVLIPRGSRVIGQYRSGAALGASRAFVIWTRILRPDGASIQIGSSGADELGRAGLAGSVDRHFFQRFGGAILLSVINAGVASIAGQPSTQVVIGSQQDAGALASSASASLPTNISPTIKVPQGSPIRIFVARDLDFTSVEDAGK